MNLLAQIIRHMIFTMAADMARNPEKYQYHARQAKRKAEEQYEQTKAKVKSKYEQYKKRNKKDPVD